MVKLLMFPVLIVVLAMHTPINAFGIVRVDIQKDNGVAFANALGNAISSKIQSWNSILNSLLQVKYSYGGTASISGSSAGSSSSSTSGTGGLNLAPIYQKTAVVLGGTAATRPPPSGRVAARLDADDEDNEVSPAAQGSAATAGRAVITVNKSILGVPAVSVSTSQSSTPIASGSASLSASGTAPNSVAYTYRKRYISNYN